MLPNQQAQMALYAARLLEADLLPLALQAAGLPADTGPEDLRRLELGDPNIEQGPKPEEAKGLCRELLLPGASGVAARLADNQPSAEINRWIQGLIWRDAFECAESRELAFETNLPGIDNSDFEQAADAARQAWERWEATDPAVKALFENFLSLCSDSMM